MAQRYAGARDNAVRNSSQQAPLILIVLIAGNMSFDKQPADKNEHPQDGDAEEFKLVLVELKHPVRDREHEHDDEDERDDCATVHRRTMYRMDSKCEICEDCADRKGQRKGLRVPLADSRVVAVSWSVWSSRGETQET